MNNFSSNFWSDPKIWIAILAIVISIFDFIFLIWFRWDQNKRWDELNLARVELSNAYFIAWEEVDKQTVFSRDWGYNPSIHGVINENGHVYTNKFRVFEAT